MGKPFHIAKLNFATIETFMSRLWVQVPLAVLRLAMDKQLYIAKLNFATIETFTSRLWMQTPLAELRSFVLSHLCNGQAVCRRGVGAA